MKKSNPELFSTSTDGLRESSSQHKKKEGTKEDDVSCDYTEYTYQEAAMPIIESAVANEFDQYRQKYLGFFINAKGVPMNH